MSTQRRGSADLTRRRGTRRERGRLLVVTEGVQTEPLYLKGLARHMRATGVQVVSANIEGVGRDPLRVVQRAVHLTRNLDAAQKYDHVWCVFDVDDHATLRDALKLAHSSNFLVALSNPCFEIWLLWHFEDLFFSTKSSTLRQRLRKHGCMDKALPRNFPYERHLEAAQRANQATLTEDPMPKNPGTTVPTLVAALAH